jgi:uncharacterized protein (DUF488 family)
MALPFFTIGHSTRSLPEFADLLKGSQIEIVADVRSIPRSRANPQFNRETLPADLEERQIGYRHIAALGGLRKKQMPEAASPNGLWRVKSFRRYADYALGPDFACGLAELRALGRERRTAIMCAEAVWWRCHRRIIADYLIAEKETVFHILSAGKVEAATLTPGADIQDDGKIRYPEAIEPAQARA